MLVSQGSLIQKCPDELGIRCWCHKVHWSRKTRMSWASDAGVTRKARMYWASDAGVTRFADPERPGCTGLQMLVSRGSLIQKDPDELGFRCWCRKVHRSRKAWMSWASDAGVTRFADPEMPG
ncbi:hypothetical protein BaRGS_00001488 [Batillaria attramentaria]|uniref:Uncharacterized protein n=1 Tax=Batillaria attramentaria TaxID=370345 RepID=A0ABD0M7S9_9CAEN